MAEITLGRVPGWDGGTLAALFVCHSLSTERRTLGPSLNVFSILNTFPECLTGLPLLQLDMRSWLIFESACFIIHVIL